jgi:hypothetical protein
MLGLDVGHEELGKDGISSWYLAVDCDTAPFGPGSRGLLFDHVFHQVRHPLKTIASLTTLKPESWAFIAEHTEVDPSEPILRRCARYWLDWNRLTERIASYQYRIEDLPEQFRTMCCTLGIKEDRSKLERLPRDLHSRKDEPLLYAFEKFLYHTRTWWGTPLRHLLSGKSRPREFQDLTWAELDRHAHDLAPAVRDLATAYGYTDDVRATV